jgi:hypothetical protein
MDSHLSAARLRQAGVADCGGLVPSVALSFCVNLRAKPARDLRVKITHL